MSPGPTFDRVYLALKDQLTGGGFAPGDHLEPSLIGEELHSSITPVRDALHRLVGERLVEAPRNDGFRVPMVTELALRQLYGWQADLLRLAVSRHRPEHIAADQHPELRGDAGSPWADVFLNLGRASGDHELLCALANACERLAAVQILEERYIPETGEELETFRSLIDAHDLAALKPLIATYQRRRDRAVPQIVAALQRSY